MTLFATVYFLTGVPILKDGRDKHISMNAVLAVFPVHPSQGTWTFLFPLLPSSKRKEKKPLPLPPSAYFPRFPPPRQFSLESLWNWHCRKLFPTALLENKKRLCSKTCGCNNIVLKSN